MNTEQDNPRRVAEDREDELRRLNRDNWVVRIHAAGTQNYSDSTYVWYASKGDYIRVGNAIEFLDQLIRDGGFLHVYHGGHKVHLNVAHIKHVTTDE